MISIDERLQTWPIEILLNDLDVEVCVSSTSSALIYSKYLFDIDAKSISKKMRDVRFCGIRGEWRKSIFDRECQIIRKVADELK